MKPRIQGRAREQHKGTTKDLDRGNRAVYWEFVVMAIAPFQWTTGAMVMGGGEKKKGRGSGYPIHQLEYIGFKQVRSVFNYSVVVGVLLHFLDC